MFLIMTLNSRSNACVTIIRHVRVFDMNLQQCKVVYYVTNSLQSLPIDVTNLYVTQTQLSNVIKCDKENNMFLLDYIYNNYHQHLFTINDYIIFVMLICGCSYNIFHDI